MRGQHSLFNELIPPVLKAPKQSGIGRNKELNQRRNEKLLYRYYFYTQIIRKNYTDTIAILSLEFDLSELRVVVCIQINYDQLKQIVQVEKPTVKTMEKKYPWINWNI